MAWDRETARKIWLALGISLGVHLAIAVVGEVSSHDRAAPSTPPPPVEISRVAMDGTTLPSGKGNSSFDSPRSQASPGTFQKPYQGLEAGVPVRLPEPPKGSQSTGQQPNQAVPYVSPVSQGPVNNPQIQYPPTRQQPQTTNPPRDSQSTVSTDPVASPQSSPSTAGNNSKPRSRGPNRAAFPITTIEPNVPQSLMSGGVANSVEVSVDIAADGSHTEKIVKTSGSGEVDSLVLDALRQWKWDPAAQNNVAIQSTQSFRFTFKPR